MLYYNFTSLMILELFLLELFHNKTPTASVSYYVGFTKHLAKI
jgi:hypothetical protein